MNISINDNLQLKPITLDDHKVLFGLMKEIYPPAYSHYWLDKGIWYVDSQYSFKNLSHELSQPNQQYYFVVFKGEIIGIFRLLFNEVLPVFSNKKAMKLHRVYLHQKVQGNGIGKQLLNYTEDIAKQQNYDILWLEVMEKQPQAFNFYKKLGFIVADKYTYEKELLIKEYRPMFAVYKEF